MALKQELNEEEDIGEVQLEVVISSPLKKQDVIEAVLQPVDPQNTVGELVCIIGRYLVATHWLDESLEPR